MHTRIRLLFAIADLPLRLTFTLLRIKNHSQHDAYSRDLPEQSRDPPEPWSVTRSRNQSVVVFVLIILIVIIIMIIIIIIISIICIIIIIIIINIKMYYYYYYCYH